MRGPCSCSFPPSDVETQRVTRSHAETCDIVNILSPGESFLAKSKAEPASSSSDVSIYTPRDGSLVAQVMPWLCNNKVRSSKNSSNGVLPSRAGAADAFLPVLRVEGDARLHQLGGRPLGRHVQAAG